MTSTTSLARERGSMLPLVAGLLALCGVTAVGIINSTDLALSRTSLQSTADMAALVGAESFDPRRAQFDGRNLVIRLTNRGVRRAVNSFVRDATDGVRLVSATSSDGVTAQVVVRTNWTPPLGSQFFPASFPIEASASARLVFGGGLGGR
jgi:uncharacterized membrane protein